MSHFITRSIWIGVFAVLLPFLAGCGLFSAGRGVERSFSGEYRELFQTGGEVIGREYSLRDLDTQKGTITSGWETIPRQSYTTRKRVRFRITPPNPGESSYTVSFRVERQTSEEYTLNYEVENVEWDDDGYAEREEEDLMKMYSVLIRNEERMDRIMEEIERNEQLERELEQIKESERSSDEKKSTRDRP